ncbi:MAG: 1-phosphofructokinase family hexose kinase [Blautia sp.]|nr:1-phosphofructokinase family hexose kinase [Blautia sp.]
MLYTLTVNPAVDYHMDLSGSGFEPGRINRAAGEEALPGGKGLNVSVMLSRFGVPSVAWGFAAGNVGELLAALAARYGCRCDFTILPAGETRINVKLDCENETAINGKGPDIPESAIDGLLEKAECLTDGDTLVLSGNLPAACADLYGRLCGIAARRGARTVVDAEGSALRDALPLHPFLIKPNEEELLGLYGMDDSQTTLRGGPADDEREVTVKELVTEQLQWKLFRLMRRCQEDGAENVLLSCGEKGAWLLTKDGRLFQAVLEEKRNAVSTVGAGDSMLAGFLASLTRDPDDYEKALRLGCAAGSATAFDRWLAGAREAEALLHKIKVQQM